jgi:hypothetical protein
MTFTLLHLSIVFFIGLILGIIFGLGLHYLRPVSHKKTERKIVSPQKDTQNQAPSSENSTPTLQPLHETTTFSEKQKLQRITHEIKKEVLHSDQTADFPIKIDIDTLSEIMHIPEIESIDEDATLVIPHEK